MKPAFLALSCLLAACAEPARLDPLLLDDADRRFAPRTEARKPSRTAELLAREELTLAEVLEIADALNPRLEIERRNIDLASAAIWEARLYPNPSVRLSVEEAPTGGSIGESKRVVGLRFPVAIGGRIGAATAAAEKERDVAAVHYVWARREILTEVKRAFIEVLASRRNLELARVTRDIAKASYDVTNERFKAQAVPEMELLKAAVTQAKAETDVKLAEKSAAVAIKSLHAQMGNVDFPRERFVGDLVTRFTAPSFETLRGLVTASHPLLEEATRQREAAELQASLVRAERIPDIDIELSAGRNGEHETIVEGGIEIPLPLFNRNQGRILAADIRVRQAELQIAVVRNELILKLTEAYGNFTAAQDRVTVYKDEILPKARTALDQTNDGYALGKFSYLDQLDAQRTLAEASFASVAALSDLNLAAIELEKLTGLKLEPIR